MEKQKALQALKQALRLEREGRDFYLKAAERTLDEKGKAMFLSLADDERIHAETIGRQIESLEKEGVFMSLALAEIPRIDLDKPLFPPTREAAAERIGADPDEVQALHLGIENEIRTFDLYRNAARETDDPWGERMYTWLAAAERRHFELLMSNYESLISLGTWGYKPMENLKMDALQVLKEGMSTEIWGKHFYEQAAARTTSEDGKRVFESLVAEEARHLDILRGEYAALSGGKSYVSIQEAMELAETVESTDIFPEAAQAKQLIPPDASDEQALRMALDFERRGYEFYSQAMEQAASSEEKAVYRFLADAEDKHYAFLQDTLEYLTSNGVWYFDDQELPFFET